MLISCLKRTVGQSEPTKEQQRRLFEGSSQQRNAANHTPDTIVFNRGFVCSAVGLVVDTLRDARRVVDSIANLATGKSNMGNAGGAETLQKMYDLGVGDANARLDEVKNYLYQEGAAGL